MVPTGPREARPDDRLRTRPGISRFSDVQLHIVVRIFDAPRNDGLKAARIFSGEPQYDFGRPSTFSAMKLRMSWGLIGAMRGIRDSRK
jgi:hypothetical protein